MAVVPSGKKKVSFILSTFPPDFAIGGGVAKRYGRTVQAFGNQGYETHVLTCVQNPTIYKNMTVHAFPANEFSIWSGHSVKSTNILDDIPRVKRIIDGSDMLFVDDTLGGGIICCIANNMGIRSIKTRHTDAAVIGRVAEVVFYFAEGGSRVSWATTSPEYARFLKDTYDFMSIRMIWPQLLWSELFYTWNATERSIIRQIQRKTWQQKLLPEDKGKSIILSVGRLSPEKRIDLLMDSIPETAVLIVHGDGLESHKRSLREKAEKTARCYFLPQYLSAKAMRSAYFGCDLFVSASDMETNGLTVVEAIACETPVAVFPAKGHLQVKDGEDGWYVDFENASMARQQLTDCLRKGQPASLAASSRRYRANQSDAQLVAYLEANVPPVRPKLRVPSMIPPRMIYLFLFNAFPILINNRWRILISLFVILAITKYLKNRM